ncbi:hypothetical protein FG381_00815 [Sutterella faecalis]|uniref:ESPR domain-containing protein n=2 Tax=Sutterella TaxID=40544 RepID=A0AAI9SBM5_9BURK|nr:MULTISPECIES: ESPR domain-containing protein [Sutterella]KAB7650982.1 hypothetical protein GBM96_07335 [Sutterella seckii]QDA53592.1 hypothetical protein FG381_00815 [Sutterella faecalis]
MNSAYRVIFSKVRNALMVVNELSSSVQKGKGCTTVESTSRQKTSFWIVGGVLAAFASLSATQASAAGLETENLLGFQNVVHQVTGVNQDYFGGTHRYSDQHIQATDQIFSGNQLRAEEQVKSDAQGGALYLFSSGATQHENTRYSFTDVTFANNLVYTTSNQDNRASAIGGALVIKGGETTFTNTVFNGNTAQAADTNKNTSSSSAYGGGTAAGGAIFADSTRNTYNYKATLTFSATENGLVSSGNTVKSGVEHPFTDGYTTKVPTAGGFLFMDRDPELPAVYYSRDFGRSVSGLKRS